MSLPLLTSTWTVSPVPKCVLKWGRDLRSGSPRRCKHCDVALLTGETAGFCCGPGGNKRDTVHPLPPLPEEFSAFINDTRVSYLSRQLNLIYSFAQMESTHEFPSFSGPQGHFAIKGRIYHRVRPEHQNSAARWLLHDGFAPTATPFNHLSWFRDIPASWITALGNALLRVNPLVHYINVYRNDPVASSVPNVSLVIKDSGTSEIAAIICLENTIQSDLRHRSVVISRKQVPRADFATTLERSNSTDHSVSTLNPFWEPLCYPLFFPQGTLGWGVPDATRLLADASLNDDVPSTLMWYCRARLLREPRFHIFGRLACEFLCDMFTRRIESDLHFVRKSLEARRGDAELMGVESVSPSENIYLPQSFIGSNAWSSAQIADALAIASRYGPPTFFITMTANPEWPEIRELLRRGQSWTDIPMVVARVFKQKFAALLRALRTMFPNAGRQIYEVYSIEFQKRGLPHAHILVKYERDCATPEDIDAVVSAELPDNAQDRALVERLMTHKHPLKRDDDGRLVHTIPGYCVRKKRTSEDSTAAAEDGTTCRFGFPKPLQQTTTVPFDGKPQYRRRRPGDEWIASYNLELLRAFDCHINVEVANSSHLFQYLFKYVHKGVDKAFVRLAAGEDAPAVDEIADYWRARYLSAGEAAWRTLGFGLTRKTPAVSQLPVHLPESSKHHQFQRKRKATSTLSLLNRYFHRPAGTFTLDGQQQDFETLTYAEYYTHFRHSTWNGDRLGDDGVFQESNLPEGETSLLVLQRSANRAHVTRIQSVRPSAGDVFYLRALLIARPSRSFDDARTVEGDLYETFQAAARILGLFADEREAEFALREAIDTLRTPAQLRMLYSDILNHDPGQFDYPTRLWEQFRDDLSKDFFYWNNGDRDLAYSLALEQIERALRETGRGLGFFGLPLPNVRAGEVSIELQRWAPHTESLAASVEDARQRFTPEQTAIFDEIVEAILAGRPLAEFIDGQAGRGKTYLIVAVINFVRSLQKIALPSATSAFAALAYPGGQTTHSVFKIPVDEFSELLRSPIEHGDGHAERLKAAAILTCDELPMLNRAAYACVDDVLRRVTGVDLPFGGKVIIFAGDFRQTCPVIRKGTAAQVIDASVKRSPLWRHVVIRRLTAPIRNAEDPEFAAWVDSIGDGAGPDVDVSFLANVVTVQDLIDFVFPADILQEPSRCVRRSILCPTNVQIDNYNSTIVDRVTGTARTYYAADRVKEAEEADVVDEDTSTLDFAARTSIPGVPAHTLTIKTNAVYRLMRNLSLSRGLVKNVRVLVKDIGTRIITVQLMRDSPEGVVVVDEDVLIPRITFEVYIPETKRTLQRRQFPLAPAYATTFNSCQGLNLDIVGMDLTRPVFSHGQLYTALSRVRRREYVRIRLPPGQTTTRNVVYRDILL